MVGVQTLSPAQERLLRRQARAWPSFVIISRVNQRTLAVLNRLGLMKGYYITPAGLARANAAASGSIRTGVVVSNSGSRSNGPCNVPGNG